MTGTIKNQLDDIREKVATTSLSYMSRTLMFLVAKIMAFVQMIPIEYGRRQENAYSPKSSIDGPKPVTSPSYVHERAVKKEEKVRPCVLRLQKLESLLEELNSRPTEIPAEKDQILHQSLERIKNMESDLERTKRVKLQTNLAPYLFNISATMNLIDLSIPRHCMLR